MKVTIEITCDNEAFTDAVGYEVSRILTKLVKELVDYQHYDITEWPAKLFDVSGNPVGTVTVTP